MTTMITCARRFTPVLALLAAGALAPRAQAAGFQLREQSASAQGSAFAGVTAGGEDVGSVFFNPAVLTRFQTNEAVFGLSFISPSAAFSGGQATRATALGGSTISGLPDHANAAKSALLPAVSAAWGLSPDLKLGFSVNVPYGLVTEYDANWIGRYHAVRSDLKTMDVAPSLAWRFHPQWSVGAAFVARKVEAELTNGADLGAAGFPATNPGTLDGGTSVKGDCWAYGYRLGVIFQPTDALRAGLSYQSRINATVKGDFGVQYNPATPAPVVAAFQARGLKDGKVEATVPMPAMWSLGLSYDLRSDFTLAAEAALTRWSSFHELRLKFDTGLGDSVTMEDWKDSWFLSLGATWRVDSDWTLRAGLAHDSTPVKDEFRTPRIPDSDRTWASLGVGYRLSKSVRLDASYSHLFAKDAKLNLQAGAPGSPDFTRGNLSGTYKNRIDIFSLQARMTF